MDRERRKVSQFLGKARKEMRRPCHSHATLERLFLRAPLQISNDIRLRAPKARSKKNCTFEWASSKVFENNSQKLPATLIGCAQITLREQMDCLTSSPPSILFAVLDLPVVIKNCKRGGGGGAVSNPITMQGNGSKFAGYHGRITVIAVKLLEFWIIVPRYCHLTTGVNVTRRIATLSPHHQSKCDQAYRHFVTSPPE